MINLLRSRPELWIGCICMALSFPVYKYRPLEFLMGVGLKSR